MAQILGGMIVVYLIYALLALCFKHKVGLIIIAVLAIAAGFSAGIIRGEWNSFIAAIITIPIIATVTKIQIRNKSKETNQK